MSLVSVIYTLMIKLPSHKFLLILFMTCILPACGGGGGGGSSLEAELKGALVSIEATPKKLLIGDRTLVTVAIREVHENGVIVKLRFPSNVRYVENTSFLKVGRESVDVSPLEGPKKSGESIYIAYYFSLDSFNKDRQGILELQLRGTTAASPVDVEVDSDSHDPTKDPAEEFRIKQPFFGAEDLVRIEVKDS